MTAQFLLYLGTALLLGGVAARHLKIGSPGVKWLLSGLLLQWVGAAWSVYAVLAELDMLNPADTVDYLTRVPAGRAALTLPLGACLLLAAHLSKFSRLTELGAAGLTLWGLAGIGHGATHGDWVRFLHTLHAGAMSVWVGGVLALLRPKTGPEQWQQFSPVAAACVFTLGLTGLLMTLNHAGGILTLPDTIYGRVLLLKIGLFSLILLLALAIRSALARGRNLRSGLLAEFIFLLIVLALTSWLTQLPPPAHQI